MEVATPKAERGKPTVVTQIYPSVPELPENVLRFYIEFNQPMPRGDVYKYVQVLDENGKPDDLPFVELDNELWNRDQTRLTLLIDPGRIKKEVKPRIDLGPVFRAGKKYTLVVSGRWPTLNGEPLGREIRKPITATAEVSRAIDPKAWKCVAPSGEKVPLQVAFDRPIDQVILMRRADGDRPGWPRSERECRIGDAQERLVVFADQWMVAGRLQASRRPHTRRRLWQPNRHAI